MTALIRYLSADVLRAQRWAAPLLCFLAALMTTSPAFGPVLSTYSMSAAALLPIAIWFTVVVMHSEEPVQATITVVTVGSPAKVRLAKLCTAFLGCGLLGLIAVTWISFSTGSLVDFGTLGAGLLDHAMTALAGVAFGALISRPVLPKMAWTVMLGVGITLAELLIPYLPPVNAMLKLYSADHPRPTGTLLLIAAGTAVLTAITFATANTVARHRT
jgi:hypothetical protein